MSLEGIFSFKKLNMVKLEKSSQNLIRVQFSWPIRRVFSYGLKTFFSKNMKMYLVLKILIELKRFWVFFGLDLGLTVKFC